MKEGTPSRTAIELRVDRQISARTIHGLIERIGELNGCTGCGLVGIDVSFLGDGISGPHPEPWRVDDLRLDGFEGLAGATISEVSEIAGFNR